MAPTTRTRPRRAPRAALGLGLGTTLVLATLVPAQGSSHREAPLITEDPAADNTDVYAFVAPDADDSVTLISNFTGFQEPGGGPNYFRFGDDVRYEIHVDNDGDAVADITYEFRFTTTTVNPDNYLYMNGQIDSITSDAWNRPQTYTVTKVEDGRREVVASDLLSPPNNVGDRSTPDYEALADQAIHDLPGGGTVFAGQRDEGFYVDIAAIFDFGGLRPFQGGHAIPQDNAEGIDSFAGYNVNSIALQVPIDDVTAGDEDVIGVWSTTSRRKVRVFAGNSSANPQDRGRWVQTSRLGMPLVNEAVVPLRFKDVFNTLRPSQDADVFPTLDAPNAVAEGVGSTNGPIPLVTDPILAQQIAALYGIDVPCTGPNDEQSSDCVRDDLVSVFLTGLEGANQPDGVRPAEMLRLNTAVPPTPFADQNRLGFVAGQNDGFPNGRRVGDDVVDISLKAVAGALRDDAPPEAAALTDGVEGNDVAYLERFPYLGTPHKGTEIDNPARVN